MKRGGGEKHGGWGEEEVDVFHFSDSIISGVLLFAIKKKFKFIKKINYLNFLFSLSQKFGYLK